MDTVDSQTLDGGKPQRLFDPLIDSNKGTPPRFQRFFLRISFDCGSASIICCLSAVEVNQPQGLKLPKEFNVLELYH
jgi:hypothetical protein